MTDGRLGVRATVLAAAIFMASHEPLFAVAADECEIQRNAYPADWKDVSKDKDLFVCSSHYAGQMKVTLGAPDAKGRRLMSLVPLTKDDKPVQDKSKDVSRIWLDKEQASRLVQGRYFATIVRQEKSCWIRGAMSSEDKDDVVFFLDRTDAKSDETRGGGAGSFYNRAPRFSVFDGNMFECEPAR